MWCNPDLKSSFLLSQLCKNCYETLDYIKLISGIDRKKRQLCKLFILNQRDKFYKIIFKSSRKFQKNASSFKRKKNYDYNTY